ncbi:MAG: NUDIX domain-containing protein [Streptosporangiales bacterium]|nr:NUDIX domain-containing protein [Streptosporangiales bacterium]
MVDEHGRLPVTKTEVGFHGKVWDVVRDTVELGAAGPAVRDYIAHPGAVAVLALDEQERVLLVRQYRHPVGAFLFELPAGLRDMDGETPLDVARRELHEETGYEADEWRTLTDVYLSPGASAERVRVYLARGISAHATGRPLDLHGEELGMPIVWVPLADLVQGVLAGELHNPSLQTGVLAAWVARADGFGSLRPADAPEAG